MIAQKKYEQFIYQTFARRCSNKGVFVT